MRHCPTCSLDFADTFDSCYRCGADLVEGSVEVPLEQAEVELERTSEAGARVLLERVKTGLVVVAALAAGGFVASTLLSPVLEIKQQWTVIHGAGTHANPVPFGGLIRNGADASALAEETGLTLQAPPEGEMVVYFPVTYRTLVPTNLPVFKDIRRGGSGIVATLGRSDQKTPSTMRVMGAALSEMARSITNSEPTVQYVVAARVPAAPGNVGFRAPADLGLEQVQNVEEVVQGFAEELTLGWFKSFAMYALGGIFAVGVFVLLILKFV